MRQKIKEHATKKGIKMDPEETRQKKTEKSHQKKEI